MYESTKVSVNQMFEALVDAGENISDAIYEADESPPVADAGEDQTVSKGELVKLDGSDSNGFDLGIQSYEWSQLSGTSLMTAVTS